jgi:hypothetical protein
MWQANEVPRCAVLSKKTFQKLQEADPAARLPSVVNLGTKGASKRFKPNETRNPAIQP